MYVHRADSTSYEENGRFRFLRIYATGWLVSLKIDRSLEIDGYARASGDYLAGKRSVCIIIVLIAFDRYT